jgi:hypothetical protein
MLSNVKVLARGSQADGAVQTIGNAELSGGARWTLDFYSSALLRAETTVVLLSQHLASCRYDICPSGEVLRE